MTGDRTPNNNSRDQRNDRNGRSLRSKRSDRKQQQKITNPTSKVIRGTINIIRNEVKAFKKEHLGARSRFDFVTCSVCLEDKILPNWKIPRAKIKDYDEFLKLTLRKGVDEETMSSDQYIDLISISKRAQAFQVLITDAKARAMSCLHEHVYTFCGSLKEMAGKEKLIPVSEYEASVSQRKSSTEAKMDEFERNYSSYKELIKPFSEFVKVGEEHTALINKVCNNLLELGKLVDDWVNEDDQYPEKLVEEYNSNKKIRDNLIDSRSQIIAKQSENTDEIEKLKRSESKADKGYNKHRKDKLKLKSRKIELEKKKKVLADKLERKRKERDHNKRTKRESKSLSPRDSALFQDKLDYLESNIEKLEAERKATDRQLRKLEKDIKPVNESTYEHKIDAVTFRHRKEELEKENLAMDAEIKSIEDRINNIDADNNTLMMIREMKLSTDVYKRSMREKQRRDASLSDGRQGLTDACSFAAPHIGKDWQKVYLSLPFDPPRDADKRHRDVDTMDYIAARNDIIWRDQALRSLEKWRSFHRRGNVKELIQTLRCVKKREIANEIENKFITSAK